jgi:hypothetical protein
MTTLAISGVGLRQQRSGWGFFQRRLAAGGQEFQHLATLLPTGVDETQDVDDEPAAPGLLVWGGKAQAISSRRRPAVPGLEIQHLGWG